MKTRMLNRENVRIGREPIQIFYLDNVWEERGNPQRMTMRNHKFISQLARGNKRQ